MLRHIALVLASLCIANSLPCPAAARKQNKQPEPKQIILLAPQNAQQLQNYAQFGKQSVNSEQQNQVNHQLLNVAPDVLLARQQFPYPDQYGLGYLAPQYQFPPFNVLPQDRQVFSRVQPQLVFYGPGGQGQPILINPGNPPGNFLVPQQPGPNVFLGQGSPQRPVFAGGFPRPGNAPPIEKDAEEVPTNPEKIPPFPSGNTERPNKKKPEKLETPNENKSGIPTLTAQNVLPISPQYTKLNQESPFPSNQYFYLNRDNFVPNFPAQQPAAQNFEASKYAQNFAQPFSILPPQFQLQNGLGRVPVGQNILQSNTVGDIQRPSLQEDQPLPPNVLFLPNVANAQKTETSSPSQNQLPEADVKLAGNLLTLDQPSGSQDTFVKSSLPLNIVVPEPGEPQSFGQFRLAPVQNGNIFHYTDDVENDAVIVDAGFERIGAASDASGSKTQASPFTDSGAPFSEPSVAQAAPGAISLAGPGGVAGASPRGTALVGKGGLAISSPQATAVAGTENRKTSGNKGQISSTTQSSADRRH